MLLLLVLLLAACSQGTNEEAVVQTVVVIATATPSATATPPPPTATPSATVTPPPATATPSATATPPPATAAPSAAPAFSYPIGLPGRAPGDGFFIRHGYATENTWYNPGDWHSGEDWYALEGDTAGAQVYAIAAGEVVYVGSNYPGRVVIVRHRTDLFSMYGHLDPAVSVREGQTVERGTLLGRVLRRSDRVPNHLHFEVRTFLTTPAVNGPRPRYGYRCGVQCPPGPGYWPITAPDHPSDLGWRNPSHVIAARAFDPALGSLGEVLVVTEPISPTVMLWAEVPSNDSQDTPLGELTLSAGERFPLLEISSGAEDSRATSAQGYQLWYRIGLADGRSGWVQALVPNDFETGNDGRASTLRFNFVPLIPDAAGAQ